MAIKILCIICPSQNVKGKKKGKVSSHSVESYLFLSIKVRIYVKSLSLL
jgi:hypothetical protein